MISKVPIATISHQMSGPKMTKQASKDDFELEMPFKKQQPIQVANAFLTSSIDRSTALESEENKNCMESLQLSDGMVDFGASSVAEEDEQISESEQCDSETSPMAAAAEEVPEFKVAEPKKYMTAADFEKVCQQLQNISKSYENSAQRYEKAIETTEKTIKTCQRAEQKIDRFCRINEKMLKDSLVKISQAVVKGQKAAAA